MKDIQTFRLADADKITNLPVNTNTELALKADKSTTYTKTETDNILSNKVDKTTTVNGKALSTNVTINKSDVGLGNVDNTTDLLKPISTATQNALNTKVTNIFGGTNVSVNRIGDDVYVSSIGGGGGSGNDGAYAYYSTTATDGQNVITLSFEYVLGNNLIVYKNGGKQQLGNDYYETNITTITFTQGLIIGDIIEVYYQNKGLNWKGNYDNLTSYKKDDAVSYNGSSYVCIADTTGNLPTDNTYWNVLAQKGDNGDVLGPISKVYGTGVTSYITLTFTPTTFSISDGTGVITNGLTGAISNISWSGLNNITDNFPTSDTTWLLIDSSGILTQQASIPTPTEYRTKILVGAIGKNAGNIIFGRTVTLPHYDGINAITDISNFLGAIQDGNINILGTATLSVNYTAGKVFSLGANATTSVYGPNIVPLSSQTPATLNAVYRNGTGGWTIGPNVTIINSALYDNGTGTLASVVPSKYTIKVFYLSSTGKVYAQQGQNIYNSLSEATAAVNTEIRENWPYGSSLVKLGYVVIKSGATATNNTTDCAIINLGKFGTGGGGGGSGGVTDHNSLTGIQGGAIGDYQHLTTAQVTKLNNQSGVNTGDQTINTGIITATAGQTVVTVGTHIVNSSKLTILVNGLEQTLGTDYTDTSTTSITFTSGLIVNDEVKYKILS